MRHYQRSFVFGKAVALAIVIPYAVLRMTLVCCHADDMGKESTGKLVIENKTITLSSAQATKIKNLVAKSKTKMHRERIPGIPWAFLTIDADHYFFPGNIGPMFETIKDGKEYRYYEDVTAEMVRGIVNDKK